MLRRVKKLTMLLMISLNSGCSSVKGLDNKLLISPEFKYVMIDGKEFIDVEKSYCRARPYSYSPEFIGAEGPMFPLPIQECQRMIGHPPKEHAEVYKWFEELRKSYFRSYIRGKN